MNLKIEVVTTKNTKRHERDAILHSVKWQDLNLNQSKLSVGFRVVCVFGG
jgi:hypothetical protein